MQTPSTKITLTGMPLVHGDRGIARGESATVLGATVTRVSLFTYTIEGEPADVSAATAELQRLVEEPAAADPTENPSDPSSSSREARELSERLMDLLLGGDAVDLCGVAAQEEAELARDVGVEANG